jgi:hypothetical protein
MPSVLSAHDTDCSAATRVARAGFPPPLRDQPWTQDQVDALFAEIVADLTLMWDGDGGDADSRAPQRTRTGTLEPGDGRAATAGRASATGPARGGGSRPVRAPARQRSPPRPTRYPPVRSDPTTPGGRRRLGPNDRGGDDPEPTENDETVRATRGRAGPSAGPPHPRKDRHRAR